MVSEGEGFAEGIGRHSGEVKDDAHANSFALTC